MKPFTVNDPSAFVNRLRWYVLALGSFTIGLCAFAVGWTVLGAQASDPRTDTVSFTWLGVIGVFTAVLFHTVGRIERDAAQTKSDLTMRLADQDDRIRRLEEQIVALTPPLPAR